MAVVCLGVSVVHIKEGRRLVAAAGQALKVPAVVATIMQATAALCYLAGHM
jgi:hypothetical protein